MIFTVVVAFQLPRWWRVLLPIAAVTVCGIGVYGWIVDSAFQRA